jgi:hypothetical protein
MSAAVYKSPQHPLSAAFTAKVAAELHDRRWSCRQAGEACGTTGYTVWRVANGSNPSLVSALLIARGLGLSLDELIRGNAATGTGDAA